MTWRGRLIALIVIASVLFTFTVALPPTKTSGGLAGGPEVANANPGVWARVITSAGRSVLLYLTGQAYKALTGKCAPWSLICAEPAGEVTNGVPAWGPVGAGTVVTGGYGLNMRVGPGTGYAVGGTLPDGAIVEIICTTYAETVGGQWGSTSVWNRLTNGLWVSDGFVDTGTNYPVAPAC